MQLTETGAGQWRLLWSCDLLFSAAREAGAPGHGDGLLVMCTRYRGKLVWTAQSRG